MEDKERAKGKPRTEMFLTWDKLRALAMKFSKMFEVRSILTKRKQRAMFKIIARIAILTGVLVSC